MKVARNMFVDRKLKIAAVACACAAAFIMTFSTATARWKTKQAVEAFAAGRGVSSEIDPKGDPATGKVFGEFEDLGFLEKQIAKVPAMKKWNDRQAWDGLSGATIQAKTMGPGVPDRMVLVDGQVIAYADGFGQYWCALPPGSYSLVGRCEGYEDAAVTLEVKAQSASYANFYLKRKSK